MKKQIKLQWRLLYIHIYQYPMLINLSTRQARTRTGCHGNKCYQTTLLLSRIANSHSLNGT